MLSFDWNRKEHYRKIKEKSYAWRRSLSITSQPVSNSCALLFLSFLCHFFLPPLNRFDFYWAVFFVYCSFTRVMHTLIRCKQETYQDSSTSSIINWLCICISSRIDSIDGCAAAQQDQQNIASNRQAAEEKRASEWERRDYFCYFNKISSMNKKVWKIVIFFGFSPQFFSSFCCRAKREQRKKSTNNDSTIDGTGLVVKQWEWKFLLMLFLMFEDLPRFTFYFVFFLGRTKSSFSWQRRSDDH